MKKSEIYSFLLSLMIDDDSLYPIIQELADSGQEIEGSRFWFSYSGMDGREELYDRVRAAFPDADEDERFALVCRAECLLDDQFDRWTGSIDAESLLSAADFGAEQVIGLVRSSRAKAKAEEEYGEEIFDWYDGLY